MEDGLRNEIKKSLPHVTFVSPKRYREEYPRVDDDDYDSEIEFVRYCQVW